MRSDIAKIISRESNRIAGEIDESFSSAINKAEEKLLKIRNELKQDIRKSFKSFLDDYGACVGREEITVNMATKQYADTYCNCFVDESTHPSLKDAVALVKALTTKWDRKVDAFHKEIFTLRDQITLRDLDGETKDLITALLKRKG